MLMVAGFVVVIFGIFKKSSAAESSTGPELQA
jgi:hypothetical protein